LPENFGRDAPYDHPDSPRLVLEEEVQHIHLQDPEKPWPIHAIQFYKTSDLAHLVYCQGAIDPECYLLIAILAPEPHKQARENQVMINLGVTAEKFRARY
jgi:mRNA interferase YafO